MKVAPVGALISLLTVVACNPAIACSPDGREGVFPQNTLSIPDSRFGKFPVSKDQFEASVEKVSGTFARLFAGSARAVEISASWSAPEVRASTTRIGSKANLTLSGGLARYPRMTPDGLVLVLCHELGHHLGGAPKKLGIFGARTWISSEGQADYYSALKCAREVWRDEKNEELMARTFIPTAVIERCQKAFESAQDLALCERTALAGRAVAETFAEIERAGPVDFDHADGSIVDQTVETHPRAQCRLDTFFAGAVCTKSERISLSDEDPQIGTCNEEKGDMLGVRPACWYRASETKGR